MPQTTATTTILPQKGELWSYNNHGYWMVKQLLSARTTTALFHWGHRRYHANSDAPAATICRDNHSMPSWSPNPLLTSHAWMCQLLLQHSLNRPKFSVIDSMLIQLSTSWFRIITQSVKITYLPKCLVFSIWAKVQRSTSKVTCITSISWSSTWEHLVYND